MADQPTPPNLGNLSAAQFLALPDWSVAATNQLSPTGGELPDTFTAMDLCVVALFYRLVRDNFAYVNDALGCNVSTPILEKINSLQGSVQWRATDNDSQALTKDLLDFFAVPLPDLLFNCNGAVVDNINGQITLRNVDAPATPAEVYHVVSARGGPATPGDVVYGLRVTQNRHYYTDVPTLAMQSRSFSLSANLTPQWSQDSSIGSKAVIAKVADYLTATETGAKRLQFEFGLQSIDIADDAAAHGTDRVLYVRWRDAFDDEQIAYAQVGSGHVGIGMGREVTLGFVLHDGLFGSTRVRFFVNGVFINQHTGFEPAEPGSDSDIRLLVGAGFDGSGWVGGPINNIYYTGSSASDAAMHAIYRIGAGDLQGP